MMAKTETVSTERLTALRQKLIDGADLTVREEEEIFAALTELLASRTQSPAEWQVEAAARVLVPVWYGGFEDQTQKEDGGWLHPPGTPNKRALDTARDVLRAASIPAPEHSMIMPLDEKGLLAAARAVYETLPNFGMERRPNTAGGYEVVRVDDTWEDAPNRHDECTRQAEAAVRAYLSALETPPLHKEGEAVPVAYTDPRAIALLRDTPAQKVYLTKTQTPAYSMPLYAAPVPVPVTITAEPLTLDEEELDTILAVGRNEQSGRITNYELKELVRVYRAALNTVKENNNASQVD